MKKTDIDLIHKYFDKYIHCGGSFLFTIMDPPLGSIVYRHKEDKHFYLAIREGYGDDVYQLDYSGDFVGVSLETFEDLRVRFKSFTGDDVENISQSLKENIRYSKTDMLDFAKDKMNELVDFLKDTHFSNDDYMVIKRMPNVIEKILKKYE